ncbi:MAG: TatD family hydrolase [Candidatus Thiodiazotropha lotti]|nr:TatD family hydrolase [Candidatus Thiodiazotropha lotti]
MTDGVKPQGHDFHCHIDLYPNPAAMIALCENNKIITLAVTTTPRAWTQNKKWASTSTFVYPACGLHPELVGEQYHEIELLERHLTDSTLIGEVGLDGSPRYQSSWENQKDVFARVLQGAQKLGGRVISIHSRRAVKEVVEMIETLTTPDRVLCILHWFSGPKSVATKAASAGCYFSVNSQMLCSKQGSEIIRNLPVDRLLTETDGPFTKDAGHKSVPSDVLKLTDRLADLRQVSNRAIEDALNNNARRVFAFAGISF